MQKYVASAQHVHHQSTWVSVTPVQNILIDYIFFYVLGSLKAKQTCLHATGAVPEDVLASIYKPM